MPVEIPAAMGRGDGTLLVPPDTPPEAGAGALPPPPPDPTDRTDPWPSVNVRRILVDAGPWSPSSLESDALPSPLPWSPLVRVAMRERALMGPPVVGGSGTLVKRSVTRLIAFLAAR